MLRNVYLVVFCMAFWATAQAAYAWGERGHRLIADVAYSRLTPAARGRVDRLIGSRTTGACSINSLADAAVWPDCVRGNPSFRYMSSWHYDNIPLCGAASPRIYCPRGACATAAVARATAALRNHRLNDQQRLRALAELAHFVGDIHQPLHAVNNRDRGGNDIRIRSGDARITNLHAFWDTELVDIAVGDNSVLAHRIVENLADAGAREWRFGNAHTWATQSHDIAIHFVYARLPQAPICNQTPIEPIELDRTYLDAAAPIVRGQIARAAVRLADLLNELFDCRRNQHC